MTAEGKEQPSLFLPGRTELAYLVVGGKSFLVMSQERGLEALRQWLPEMKLTGDAWVDNEMVEKVWKVGITLCSNRVKRDGPVVVEVDPGAIVEGEKGPEGETRYCLVTGRIRREMLFEMVAGVARQIDSRTSGLETAVSVSGLVETRRSFVEAARRLENGLSQEIEEIKGNKEKLRK